MSGMEFKRGLTLWHGALDWPSACRVVPHGLSSLHFRVTCLWNVTTVAALGATLGGVATLMAERVPVVPVTSASPLLPAILGPGSVDQGGQEVSMNGHKTAGFDEVDFDRE